MREALYFRNMSFSVKLDSETDVSKYGQIRRPYPAGPDMKIWMDFVWGRIWYPVPPYLIVMILACLSHG